MAITKLGSVAIGGATNSATADATHTLDAGDNRIVIVIAGGEDSLDPTLTCVYDQGGDNIVMTPLTEAQVEGSLFQVARMFFALEADLPTTGAKTVRVTSNVTMNELQIEVIALQDAIQETPEASEINTAENVATISKAITTLTDGAWIISGDSIGQEESFTHGAGQIEEADFTQGSGAGTALCMTSEEIASAGADTQSHTAAISVVRHAMVLAAFATILSINLYPA